MALALAADLVLAAPQRLLESPPQLQLRQLLSELKQGLLRVRSHQPVARHSAESRVGHFWNRNEYLASFT
jgi:hypothetical protein